MRQILIDILKAWWQGPLPLIRPRQVNLDKFFDPNIKKIISVIGFRRVGKTFTALNFVKKHGKERTVYLNLEDERLPRETKVLTAFIETVHELRGAEPLVLIMDEIQEIPEWSKWARRINETTPHRLILTGSSSKLSSQEIPTELRGQTLTAHIFPLSFPEFLNFRGFDISGMPKAMILNAMREYLFFGGMPEIVLSGDEGLKPMILSEYFGTFVQRDVIERYKIRKETSLRDIIQLILNTRTYTYSKLANTMKSLGHDIGKATTVRYMNYLASSFFHSSIDAFSAKAKDRITSPKKGYVIDTYFPARYASAVSDNIGMLMEQAVYLHYLRKKAADATLQLYYWKDYSQNEVDFVVERKRQIELVQVSYVTDNARVAEREKKALAKAAKIFGTNDLKLITWDYEAEAKIGDNISVKYIPIWKFLE